MKKILIFSIVFLGMLYFTNSAFAQTVTPTYVDPCELVDGQTPWYCLSTDKVGFYLESVVNLAFVVAVILAFGYLIYGGIRWITSGGDKGGVENARNTIVAAIIGLILVFLSYTILNFIVYFLTGSGVGAIEIPNITGN